MVERQLGPASGVASALTPADVAKIVAKTNGYSGARPETSFPCCPSVGEGKEAPRAPSPNQQPCDSTRGALSGGCLLPQTFGPRCRRHAPGPGACDCLVLVPFTP